jgi:hypothetical protein
VKHAQAHIADWGAKGHFVITYLFSVSIDNCLLLVLALLSTCCLIYIQLLNCDDSKYQEVPSACYDFLAH